MANNADLTKNILTLAPETVVEGKTNKELVGILKGLRANEKTADDAAKDDEASKEKADAKAKEKADAEAKEKADAEAKAVKLPPYTIAENRSVTCAKGSLKQGVEIKAEYLGKDGDKELKRLIEKGFVVKNKL